MSTNRARAADRPPSTHGDGTSMHHVTVEDALHGLLLSSRPESDRLGRRDEPAKTIKASGNPPLHYAMNRPITMEEMKALFSLPPEYQLCGSERSQRKQLGNSFPVELTAALGKSRNTSLPKKTHKYKLS
jgi:site-specific DNA-cytosine methylase